MASWTNIADATLEPGKPIRAIDARALRENPIAIAEGAAGAPKIAGQTGPAVETGGITNRNLIGLHAARITDPATPLLTVTASDAFPVGVAETNVAAVGGGSTVSVVSYVLAWTTTIVRVTGTVRFKGAHRVDSNTGISQLRVLKNGSVINTWSTSTTSSVTRSEDIAVVPGDVITWEHRSSSSFGEISFFTKIDDTASDGYATAPLYIKQSDL
jgi:hypothetical protein